MPKKKVEKKVAPVFPAQIVDPVKNFLREQLKKLEVRRKDIIENDPFSDPERAYDNASPDTDAEEQFGHARAAAVKTEIDRMIVQTKKALSLIKIGKYGVCTNCGKMIDTDRLMIKPEATLCVKCEAKLEKRR